MKNLIDHGQEIMDRKSWTENHGHENWSKERCETDLNILPEVLDEFKQVEATGWSYWSVKTNQCHMIC